MNLSMPTGALRACAAASLGLVVLATLACSRPSDSQAEPVAVADAGSPPLKGTPSMSSPAASLKRSALSVLPAPAPSPL